MGIGNGEWGMGNGEWGMGNGQLVIGHWSSVIAVARTMRSLSVVEVSRSAMPSALRGVEGF
ncbi:MAG: hypothetical protein EAZ09_16780 [Oscillatoriales cyanobacterium]|nr:MAG: hypothetical protein EAZ18_10575 [Oscillatoriales cyanobacterium]TAH19187.1 MAG: hypothetical protein EAZ09_16780 [Oscillatoriales cyanobacterium]